MVKALIAYHFEEENSTLVNFLSVPSELYSVVAWEWKLLEGVEEKASSHEATWALDFATEAGGDLNTGSYKVSLTVTNSDAETDTAFLLIGYNKEDSTIGVFSGVYDQVQATLQGAIEVNSQEFLTLRNKWQSLLGPSLGIDPLHYHNEAYYTSLQNTLIAYLVVRSIIQSGANRILASTSGAEGLIKRVETGPVNSEWFDPSSVYASVFKPGGLWEDLVSGICGIAATIGIYIEGCSKFSAMPPRVSYPGDYSYQQQYILAPQFTHRNVH